jgi:hypothetical protein
MRGDNRPGQNLWKREGEEGDKSLVDGQALLRYLPVMAPPLRIQYLSKGLSGVLNHQLGGAVRPAGSTLVSTNGDILSHAFFNPRY